MPEGTEDFSTDKRIPMEDRWATVKELAELYSMSDTSVRKRVASGEWPSHRLGRTVRFSPDDQSRIRYMWKSTWEGRVETKEDKTYRKELLSRLLR